jgi:hypothetical protein
MPESSNVFLGSVPSRTRPTIDVDHLVMAAATGLRASAPPFRAGVKARVGGPVRPECALSRAVLLLDVLTYDA